MSMSLVFLLPLILLGVVGALCFVGCGFSTHGLQGSPFTGYSGVSVLPTANIIGYWPLKEHNDTDAARDLVLGNDGKYIDPATAMPDTIYPWIGYSVPNGANPDALSADAPGSLQL